MIPLVLISSPASSGHHKDIAEMTTTAQASGGNGNGGGEAAVAADPSAFNAAAATVTADDNDIDAAGAQSEPRQECSPAVAAATAPGSQARDEIFTWEAPHATYALGWSVRFFLFALGFRFPFFFSLQPSPPPKKNAQPPLFLISPSSSYLSFFTQQNRPDKPFRLAVGSFVEDFPNRVDIVTRALF